MPKEKGGSRPRGMRPAAIWWIAGIAVGLTVLLIILNQYGTRSTKPAAASDQERNASRNIMGSADAPVELIEYSDFRCPSCQRAQAALREPLEQLAQNGTIRLVYKHMLVIGDKVNSQIAAEAAECAADQGYFWAFHDLLFANQAEGQGWTRDAMKSYARQLGLEPQAFSQCIDSEKYAEKVLSDSAEGYAVPEIRGTPSYLVNGQLLELKESYNEIIDAINTAAGAPITRRPEPKAVPTPESSSVRRLWDGTQPGIRGPAAGR